MCLSHFTAVSVSPYPYLTFYFPRETGSVGGGGGWTLNSNKIIMLHQYAHKAFVTINIIGPIAQVTLKY